METISLTRPPRTKRPPEVVRHVDELMDAYRRVQAGRKPRPGVVVPPARTAKTG